MSIDVVPAFACGSDYEIPDSSTGTWTKTNPKIHADKAIAAHQAYSSEWKGLVRMVKYWNNPKHGDQKPVKPSFLIQVMALQWGGSFEREIQSFFATLAERINDEWPDPACLGPPISNGMDAARKARARALLQAAEREASAAIQLARQGRTSDAFKAWRHLFAPNSLTRRSTMASSPEARWHGDNYQSRFFWENALGLLRENSCVEAVTFEADGPKSFDDVVVHYNPPIERSLAARVDTDYHQVKWHVTAGGRFGFAGLIDPAFIGAASVSVLQRLQQARRTASPSSCFTLVTTDRVQDGDPLGDILFRDDLTILTEKLFDGTTTDKSRMGEVRALWRNLATDDELRSILLGFRIIDGHRSLEEMRRDIEWRAESVCVELDPSASDFRLDELARRLKSRNINRLDRDSIKMVFKEEGLTATRDRSARYTPVAIRSFLGPAADTATALPANTLLLVEQFRQRYLREEFSWGDIAGSVEPFLLAAVKHRAHHLSIAFLAGSILHVKSGMDVQLMQKGRVGGRIWRADDGSERDTGRFMITNTPLGSGTEIAIGIGVAQNVTQHVKRYAEASLPEVGEMTWFELPVVPGQQIVKGGGHAAALAEQIANEIRGLRVPGAIGRVHIFAACPNTLMFYLGQQAQAIAPCTTYEYDFDQKGNRTYQPAFASG